MGNKVHSALIKPREATCSPYPLYGTSLVYAPPSIWFSHSACTHELYLLNHNKSDLYQTCTLQTQLVQREQAAASCTRKALAVQITLTLTHALKVHAFEVLT